MQLDMNLLVALDALLETSSVGGAAARMHVSSPAMSRTLDRIRHMTGDPIMVRAGRHMVATPYAESIRPEVHDIVLRSQSLLVRQLDFYPTQLERTFTVMCHDALACALGPVLLAALRAAAPKVRLRILAETLPDTAVLRQSEVDIQIGATVPDQSDVQHVLLGHDILEVAMRPEHPLAGQVLTISAYAAAQHLIMSRRGRLRDQVDEVLAGMGLMRSVVSSAPTVSAALCMARTADLLVSVPRRACGSMAASFGLVRTPLPFSVSPTPLIAAWHIRNDGDQAHVWLRETVAEAANSMLEAQL